MSGLNQYEISRILGSKVKPVKDARFGNLPLLETTAEATNAADRLRRKPDATKKFGYEEDRVVVQAFENARDGASPDALLWDRKLLKRFVRHCLDPDFTLSDRRTLLRPRCSRLSTVPRGQSNNSAILPADQSSTAARYSAARSSGRSRPRAASSSSA